jgi:hypothetical protein
MFQSYPSHISRLFRERGSRKPHDNFLNEYSGERVSERMFRCDEREIVVPRMLRSAISAFTRVFDALCLRGVVRC